MKKEQSDESIFRRFKSICGKEQETTLIALIQQKGLTCDDLSLILNSIKMRQNYTVLDTTEQNHKEISMKTDAGVLHIRANPENQSVAIMLDPENGNEEIDIVYIHNFDDIEVNGKHNVLKNIRVEVCEYEAGECMLHEHLIYPEEADETPDDD